MDLNKILEDYSIMYTDSREEAAMREAIRRVLKDLNKRIGYIEDARDGFEEGYNQGISDVRVSIKKILQDL